MSGPVRTCIGCKIRDDKARLLRIVAEDGSVAIDFGRTRPGRGAYLHPRPECLDQALKRRSLGRALRSEVDGQRAAAAIREFLSALT
jgi:predicted RNA-binding protein YlxR (DUF448 family)